MEVVQFGNIHGRKNERVWMFFKYGVLAQQQMTLGLNTGHKHVIDL